jgi:uncharacterized protein (TIGR02996 family)
MTDRDALLRAICDNPDDDAPRLIYADWLDEHGDQNLAEFVRVQIELASVSESTRSTHPLLAREAELFGQRKSWKNIVGHDNQTVVNFDLDKFHRGFHHVWVGEVIQFVRLPRDSCRFGPIDCLHIGLGSPKSADLVYAEKAAAMPLLGSARTVSLLGLALTNKWVEHLLTRSKFAGWKRLELYGNKLSDTLCKFLAASPLAASRCEIVIDSNRVTNAGREMLRSAFGTRHLDRNGKQI